MSGSTLEDIEERWAEERTSSEPTDIPEEFYERVSSYIAKLGREVKESQDLRRELLQEELNRVVQMTQEIHLFRVLKSIDSIVRGSLPSSLLERERRAMDEVRESLGSLYDELVAPAIGGKAELKPRRKRENVPILILSKLPQFVGKDLRRYGPFKRGEVANLPRRSAEILRKRGLAREVNVKST